MGRIAILNDTVADQIAAGEVVERPASVVKELVENALDAGATSITVEIEDGGRTLIRVADDGTGMDRDDAVMAIERHATSKIRTAGDLVGVATYGFRGEALPAIGSVAHLDLETATRTAPAAEATLLNVIGGRLETIAASARQPGTTVTVRRLFFNTPARRKFLRAARSEIRAVVESLSTLALARLDVSFRLVSDGRVLVDAPRVASVADRIAALFGRELAEQMVPAESANGSVSVRGFIQRPADARPAGRRALLYVNGRPFRDPFLVRAAEAGYRATIAPGNRPSMFFSLSVPGDAVDVNVHPAKLEVRFRDRFMIEHIVQEAVHAALRPVEAAAVVSGPRGEASNPWRSEVNAGSHSSVPLFDPGPDAGDQSSVAAAEWTPSPERGRPALQVFSSYLVFETPEGVAIVDQHSAHERVLYERVMAQLTSGGAASQRLLLPLVVDLGAAELEATEAHRDLLDRIGFELEPFGGHSVVLHAVPNPHPRFDARRCFEELAADLARGRFGGLANRLERFAQTYACKAAIKAGQPLDEAEIRDLLARLFACELPPHDVHGRPTIVQLPRGELERRFGRA